MIRNGKSFLWLGPLIFNSNLRLDLFDELDTAQLAAMEKTKTNSRIKTISDVKNSGNRYDARMRSQVIITASHKDRFFMIQPLLLILVYIKNFRDESLRERTDFLLKTCLILFDSFT